MRKIFFLWFVLIALLLASIQLQATGNSSTLEIYWIDVDGGAATLIVTPARQSVLIDTGWVEGPSSARIYAAAHQAGLTRIDYLILTHFHLDHFGGAAGLAKLIPIGTVFDNGIPAHNPDAGGPDDFFLPRIEPYRTFPAEHRAIIELGQALAFRSVPGTAELSLRCMGARGKFFHSSHDPENSLCGSGVTKETDTSDNRNSVVSLLQFGAFKLFVGGDLTWNMEEELVCPTNSIGHVDVYQVDHHGMDISNNPLLLRSLAPTISVMSNGERKGGAAATLATLRATPSIAAMYQMHLDARGGTEFNTENQHIANLPGQGGNFVKCTVAADGSSYTLAIPATGYSHRYLTQSRLK